MFNGLIKPKIDISMAIKIIVFVFGLGIAYATLRITTGGLSTDMKEIKPLVMEHDKKIAVIETKLDYISAGIDEIKRRVKR